MTIQDSHEILAVNGGKPVRSTPMPSRRIFDEAVFRAIQSVFERSWEKGVDFGFQGETESHYTRAFADFQGGGFADGVSSGTAAVYLSLCALDIETGSDIIVSPVTDPGGINPVIFAGMNPIIADSSPDSFNIDVDEFRKSITPKTRAALLTHIGGHPIDMDPITTIAKDRGIKIIEDCSQAHGTLYKGRRVGCFGDVAAFSTMYRKMHATGGCGGVIFTKNEDIYWSIRSLADRGKPFRNPAFDLYSPYNPREFLFPALNFNLDELSCAIGISTLARLQETIDKRYDIVQKIDRALEKSSIISSCRYRNDCIPSLYFHTVKVDIGKLKVSKTAFAEAVAAEGISINPDYRNVVAEWPWIKKYINHKVTPNATKFREETFNILFNEMYEDPEIEDIIKSILKVESHYGI